MSFGKKIFVSWAGGSAKKVADRLRKFLPMAYPGSEVFFSERDIQGGDLGIEVILEELRYAQAGLLVLTEENFTAPWVLFEAGVLKGGLGKTVIPLLCGIDLSVLNSSPLAQIQCRKFSREGMLSTINDLNSKILLNQHDKEQITLWFEAAWNKHKMDELVAQYPVRRIDNTDMATIVAENTAAAIMNQGELATMNFEDLVERLEQRIRKQR